MGWLKENWLSLLALPFVLAAVAALIVMPSEDQNYDHCAMDAYERAVGNLDLDASGEIQTYSEDTTQQPDIIEDIARCSDLAAQWHMAETSKRTLVVGFVGMVLLYLTLVQTSKAARSASDAVVEARKATKVAWISAGHAEESLKINIAANDSLVFVTDVVFDNSVSPPRILVTWTNFGNSPALARRMWFDYAVVDAFPDVPTFTTSARVATHRIIMSGEAANIRIKESRDNITIEDWESCVSGVPTDTVDGGPYFFVWGRLEYTNYVGKTHYSRFGMIATEFGADGRVQFGRKYLIPDAYSYEPDDKFNPVGSS